MTATSRVVHARVDAAAREVFGPPVAEDLVPTRWWWGMLMVGGGGWCPDFHLVRRGSLAGWLGRLGGRSFVSTLKGEREAWQWKVGKLRADGADWGFARGSGFHPCTPLLP